MGWTAITKPVAGPDAGASKHSRTIYDSLRQRIVKGGGDRDGSDDGQPDVWAFTTGTSTSTHLATTAGSNGDLRPAYPDNCTWVYDTRRDRAVMMRSFWFGLTRATALHPTKPVGDWVMGGLCFNFTTNLWENPLLTPGSYPASAPAFPTFGFGGDSNSNFGVYDPITDSVLRFFWGGWGNSLQQIFLADTGVEPPGQIVYSCGAGYVSMSFDRGYHRDIDAHSRQHALDVQGRAIYAIAQSSANVLPAGDTGWGLIKVPLADPTRPLRIALPPEFIAPVIGSGSGIDNLLCFDSIRRVLIHPMINGFGGEVTGTLTYAVDTGVWAFYASTGPPYPQGNCLSFDPSKGVAVLTGGKATTSVLRPGEAMPNPTSYFTFAATGAVTPPPPIDTVNVRETSIDTAVNFPAGTVAGNYVFTVTPSGGATVTHTSATPDIKFTDWFALIVGTTYTFTAKRRNFADTLDLAPAVTKVQTFTGQTQPPPPPDTTPPVITLTAPAVGATVAGVVAIVYTATDIAGINRVEIRIDNVLLTSSNWNTTTHANGAATIKAQAWDNANPQNTAFVTRTVTVNNPAPPPSDVTPPTITFISPASGATVSGIVPVLFTATDASGINRTEFRIDGVLQSTTNWDTRLVANGSRTMRADAWDNATPQNTTFVTQSVTVANPVTPPPNPADVTPPVVVIDSPADLATVSGLVPILFTATDDNIVARTEVTVNGVLLSSAVFDTLAVPNGVATIRVTAYDAADPTPNSAFQEITVTVDNVLEPPPPPPTPVVEVPLAIFLDLGTRDRVPYVLWAHVPVNAQEAIAATAHLPSAWPRATAEEIADIEAGRVAERFGYLTREDKTDAELQAELMVLWARFDNEIQGHDTWILTDTFWTGTAWVKR